MTNDEYVISILNKYTANSVEISKVEKIANVIAEDLKTWAGNCLSKIDFSGAYAKGTAIKGSSDIDLFISLKSNTNGTLGEIYEMFYNKAIQSDWQPRKQNVSIRIYLDDYEIDLVPARKQGDYHVWHSIYKNKTNSWTQTNFSSHISIVRDSGRTDEIRAIKIWRNLNKLDFPSFYLELIVINALYNQRTNNLAVNVLTALRYIADYIQNTRVIDPANSNNIISNDLTDVEKTKIAQVAQTSAIQEYWENIIW
jgi:Second Messenger Oligonucleotide or Dinucleotide Synthetase domain